MIDRHFSSELKTKIQNFPVVALLGARQCGKTTFIKSALPDWTYQDLERPTHKTPLVEDPEGRIRALGDHVIFDEAQQVPALFSVLRSIVDEHPDQYGRYTLLSSASPQLIKTISESLAGRCAFIDMHGFCFSEIESRYSLDDLWLRGGFPRATLQDDDALRADWFEGYERTFVERDLNLLGLDVSSQTMRRLLLMSAHVNSRLYNASEIANSLGVNYQTVNRYVDILEQVFLIRRLSPWFANIGKRLTKHPKFMFRDSGFFHFLIGVKNRTALETHALRGPSWEAFGTEQIIAALHTHQIRCDYWFYRTAAGAEVDLLIRADSRVIPVEFKLHSAPDSSMVRGLVSSMQDLGCSKGFIVYPGTATYTLKNNISVVPLVDILRDPQILFS